MSLHTRKRCLGATVLVETGSGNRMSKSVTEAKSF